MEPHTYIGYTGAGTKAYLTFTDGTVKVTMDGSNMQVLTEHDRITDIYGLND